MTESGGQPFVFISYRREDSAAAARYIFEMIGRHFGSANVFLDVENIEGGADFNTRILGELERATVVIALIGPHWLHVQNKYGRRRIDIDDDWVRRELIYSLNNQHCKVVPAYLLDTAILDSNSVDDKLVPIGKLNSYRLRDEAWHDDLIRLMKCLEGYGFVRQLEDPPRYPTPKIQVRQLAALELAKELETMEGWRARSNERQGSELYKAFEFASFRDAMSFMHEAMTHIEKAQHHPRWENMWRTVTISLSTWDIGSRISPLDANMARYFNELRKRWAPPKPPIVVD